MRAQPPDGKTVGPRLLHVGGSALQTQPDGLWISVSPHLEEKPEDRYADCIVIESCNTKHNFLDKRSRYASRTGSLVMKIPEKWLRQEITRQKAGKRSRSEMLGIDPADLLLPVRHLRVLYVIPNDGRFSYRSIAPSVVLDAHEYLAPQSILPNYTSQRAKAFLKSMAPDANLYKKGRP